MIFIDFQRPSRLPIAVIGFMFIGLSFAGLSANAQNTKNNEELKQINSSLKLSAKTLKKNKATRVKTRKNINVAEREIAQNQTRSKQTKQKLAKTKAQLQKLEGELLAAQTQLKKSKGGLGDLLQANYLMGKQSGLKIALSQQGTQHAARLNHYAKILSDARQQQLNQFAILQKQLQNKDKALSKQNTALLKLSETLAADKSHLATLKTKRIAMLQTLDAAITDGSDQITRLKQRKKNLEKVLAKIVKQQRARAVARTKERAAKKLEANKAKAKGIKQVDKGQIRRLAKLRPNKSLPLPVKAKIVARFGDKRRGSGLPWSGILLQGKAGSRIRAISAGEVVYADWLQGYGQMVIVDHGRGVMSLYGHNQSIHPAVGDYVEQSAIIADMGDTAGLKNPALYFEIRQDGEAQNPLKWCRS